MAGCAVVPHVWGTGIGLVASLQFMATLPPTPLSMNPKEPMLEYDTSSHPFCQDPIGHAMRMSDGKVKVPQNPGIGIEADRDTLERHGRQVSQPRELVSTRPGTAAARGIIGGDLCRSSGFDSLAMRRSPVK
jgi:hypothetical protein